MLEITKLYTNRHQPNVVHKMPLKSKASFPNALQYRGNLIVYSYTKSHPKTSHTGYKRRKRKNGGVLGKDVVLIFYPDRHFYEIVQGFGRLNNFRSAPDYSFEYVIIDDYFRNTLSVFLSFVGVTVAKPFRVNIY